MSNVVHLRPAAFSSTDSSTATPTAEENSSPATAVAAPSAPTRRSSTPPKRGLTEAFVADLAHGPARYEVRDPKASGLRLRVAAAPGNTKAWVWYAVDGGKRLCITLGRWPAVTVDAARLELEKMKARKASGALAQHLEQKDAPPPVAPGALLLREVAEDYYRTQIKGKVRYPEAVRAVIDNHVIPRLGPLEVAKLTTRVLREPAELAVNGGAEVYAAKVLQVTKAIVRFAVERGDLEIDVGAPLRPKSLGIVTSRRRTRSLDDAELGPVLAAVDTLGEPTRTLMQLLLLTGVRTGELLRARWSEIDLDAAVWTIPPERQKLRKEREQDAKPWRVPLSAPAVTLLKHLRTFDRKSPWVAASSESAEGHVTDKVLGRALRRLQGSEPQRDGKSPRPAALKLEGQRVSPHDFRRALRGWLARNACPLEVAERCLGHSLRALGGVVATYAADDLFDARREWMERWAAHLDAHRTGAESVMS
ncbi:site-specific integrase [Anaeromyxobacter sp. SG66]|uniref:tyrosine-type recombinase/integrase n=1 Tax=Anaeromyxobacter sp. SG66 TaxID=2925410 RepID=UPI001F5A583C|nr:site-specific integrase [Anaeromyxobacter sp. SG66]